MTNPWGICVSAFIQEMVLVAIVGVLVAAIKVWEVRGDKSRTRR